MIYINPSLTINRIAFYMRYYAARNVAGTPIMYSAYKPQK